MPTVDERARAMLADHYDVIKFHGQAGEIRQGLLQMLPIGQQVAVAALTTALKLADEARAVALEEAARVAEASTCNPEVHSDEFNGTYRVATERIAAAIRAITIKEDGRSIVMLGDNFDQSGRVEVPLDGPIAKELLRAMMKHTNLTDPPTYNAEGLARDAFAVGYKAALNIKPAAPSGANFTGTGPVLCEDCPPSDYPTDKTRCLPCPRRAAPSGEES